MRPLATSLFIAAAVGAFLLGLFGGTAYYSANPFPPRVVAAPEPPPRPRVDPPQPSATPEPPTRTPQLTTADDQGSWPCDPGLIKGNQESRIYHMPGQRDYAKTRQRVTCFRTEEQAIAAGFRKAER